LSIFIRKKELASAGLQAGEIAVIDKIYVHFANLFNLTERGIFWVIRTKDNLCCRVCRKRLRKPEGNIIREDEIILVTPKSRTEYPQRLRRVVAWVEVDGKWTIMIFLTNNFDWATNSVWDRFGLFELADFYETARHRYGMFSSP
jgi:hypothetical protein